MTIYVNYGEFVKFEYEKLIKKYFKAQNSITSRKPDARNALDLSVIEEGSGLLISIYRKTVSRPVHPNDILFLWYLINLQFLNNPKNSKYVLLLISFFEKPEMDLKKRSEQFKQYFNADKVNNYKNTKLVNPMIEDLKIKDFSYSKKISTIVKELIRRCLILKHDRGYYINYQIFSILCDIRVNCIGKTDYTSRVLNSKETLFQPYLSENRIISSFDNELIIKLFGVISSLKMEPFRRIHALEKFNFLSFICTWRNLVEDIIVIHRLLLKKQSDVEIKYLEMTSIIYFNKEDNFNHTFKVIKELDVNELQRYLVFLDCVISRTSEINNLLGTKFGISNKELDKIVPMSLTTKAENHLFT